MVMGAIINDSPNEYARLTQQIPLLRMGIVRRACQNFAFNFPADKAFEVLLSRKKTPG
jgi:hypothetical protein